MPKAIKKRVEKKSVKEDSLSETVVDIREKLKERQRTLVYSLLTFGAVVIAIVAIFSYNRATASKAADLELEGYKLLYGDSQTPFSSPADRYKAALEKFKASYAAKKNPVVLLYTADSYYEMGNYDEAIKTLKDLTAQNSDPKIVSLAYYKLSVAQMKKGDMNGALSTLTSLAGIKDAPLQDMALMESGKALELMGKADDAKKKYKELVDKFPKSALAGEAKAKLGS